MATVHDILARLAREDPDQYAAVFIESQNEGVHRVQTPDKKVTSAGLAGALTVLAVFIASRLGLEITEEAAAAITTLLMVVTGYVVPPSPTDTSVPR